MGFDNELRVNGFLVRFGFSFSCLVCFSLRTFSSLFTHFSLIERSEWNYSLYIYIYIRSYLSIFVCLLPRFSSYLAFLFHYFSKSTYSFQPTSSFWAKTKLYTLLLLFHLMFLLFFVLREFKNLFQRLSNHNENQVLVLLSTTVLFVRTILV